MNDVTLYYESLKMLDKNINKLTTEVDKLQGELTQLIISRDIIEKRLRDAEHAEYSASALNNLEEEHKKESETQDWFLKMVNEEDDYAELEAEEQNKYDYSYEKAKYPEYIVASTSYMANETYVFEANADGEITSLDEYGGLAERWGDENWQNPDDAVRRCMVDSYHLVKKTDTRNGCHYLFRLIAPNELDYFDGDESDRISY